MKHTKEEILEKIREAKLKEEMAIPIYTSHIKEVLFWSGISEKKKNTIVENLKTLERESEIHIAMLRKVEEIFIKSQNKNA